MIEDEIKRYDKLGYQYSTKSRLNNLTKNDMKEILNGLKELEARITERLQKPFIPGSSLEDVVTIHIGWKGTNGLYGIQNAAKDGGYICEDYIRLYNNKDDKEGHVEKCKVRVGTNCNIKAPNLVIENENGERVEYREVLPKKLPFAVI